ncbi:MAG: ATP-binding protein [Campylobacterales bacterium]|nr:ATP-binding protein [Campylobacterales bacterium]
MLRSKLAHFKKWFRCVRDVTSYENLEKLRHKLKIENIKVKDLAKEAEQFSLALDQSSILSKTDTRGVITYVNQKFCDVSGYTKEELIGNSHSIVRHPDMPSSVFESMWNTLHSKQIFKIIIQNLDKNHNSYFVDSTIIPILNSENEIVEYIAVRYDVTDLVKAKNEALQAQKAKDDFLAIMSHELRTPLNSIIGFTELAHKKIEDESVNKLLDISLENSHALLHLINDILDISKMKSGKFSITNHPFNPGKNLKMLLHTFEELCKNKGIVTKYKIDKTLDIMLDGDWQRISQIITNLTSNAIKFTPSHKSIKIVSSYENNIFLFSVVDTGIGISEEAQKYIFKPFEQADSTITREYGGTGLGLSISLELAKMMNGTLELESNEGKGTSFTLKIPLDSV